VDDPEFTEPPTARPIEELLVTRRAHGGGGVSQQSEGTGTNRGRKSIPIEQFDIKTGEVVHRYNSATEAASLINGSQGIISDVCRGQGKIAYNFGWRLYKGPLSVTDPEFFQPPGYKSLEEIMELRKCPLGNPKPVEQIDLASGEVLAKYPSVVEASRKVKGNGNSSASISNACNGKVKSVHGFGWRFCPAAPIGSYYCAYYYL
jgi:hypothetical protein